MGNDRYLWGQWAGVKAEVEQMRARGFTPEVIAQRLAIDLKTVKEIGRRQDRLLNHVDVGEQVAPIPPPKVTDPWVRKEADRLRAAEYREENRERIRARDRAYYESRRAAR